MKNAGYVRNLQNKFDSLLLKIQNDDELNKIYRHLERLKGMRHSFAKHGGDNFGTMLIDEALKLVVER